MELVGICWPGHIISLCENNVSLKCKKRYNKWLRILCEYNQQIQKINLIKTKLEQ